MSTGATSRRDARSSGRALLSGLGGAGAITVGSLVANVAGYLLHLPASRWLGPGGYGAFAALLSMQLLVAVPALALQAVVARERVRGGDDDALRAVGVRTAALVAVVAAAMTGPVSMVLDTPVAATAAALAPGPLLCLLATEQGLVQGLGRFRTLGVLLALAGVGKVAPAVMVLAVGGGVGTALGAGALGVAGVWVVARLLAARHPHGSHPHGSRSHCAGPDTARPDTARPLAGAPARGRRSLSVPMAPTVTSVLAAGQVQLVLMALTSVDLLLARALLDPQDAGRYALGAVAAKAAFWLPQAVGTVLYPRMADPVGHRRAVRTAMTVLAGIGAVVVVVVWLAAPVVPLLVGQAYRPVVDLLWGFAGLGVLLSLLQATLLSSIAADRTGDAVIAWAGLVGAALAVWAAPREVSAVLAATTAVVALTVAGVSWRALTAGDRRR